MANQERFGRRIADVLATTRKKRKKKRNTGFRTKQGIMQSLLTGDDTRAARERRRLDR